MAIESGLVSDVFGDRVAQPHSIQIKDKCAAASKNETQRLLSRLRHNLDIAALNYRNDELVQRIPVRANPTRRPQGVDLKFRHAVRIPRSGVPLTTAQT